MQKNDRFGKEWSSGSAAQEYPTDQQAQQGLSFLGATPPSWNLHDAMFQALDWKDNFLFEQIKAVLDEQGIAFDLTEAGTRTQLAEAISEAIADGIANQQVATEAEAGIAAIASQTEVDAGEDDAKFVTPLKLKNRLDQISVWSSKAIAEPFPIFDHLPGIETPPTDNPNFRFIKLSAGENGVGGYNEGVLINETVTAGDPHPTTTAEINLPSSPWHGYTINLINTERRSLRAGQSGVTQNDALQQMYGEAYINRSNISGVDGVFTSSSEGSEANAAGDQTSRKLIFDASRMARTANETRPRNIGATYYMRIL